MSLTLSEALLLCLAGSLIWAPMVYLGARWLDRDQSLRVSEKIWIAALAAAVLPAALAPAFSSVGLSLRPAIVEAPAAFEPLTAPQPTIAPSSAAPAVQSTGAALETVAAPIVTTETIFALIGLLYLYGAGLAFALWLFAKVGFALSIVGAQRVRDDDLIAAIDDWRLRFGIRATPRLLQSSAVSSVCVYGFFRPVILIPTTLRQRVSREDLLLMCAHELAHVKRGDVRLFAVCAAARILFWFNPFIKRIAQRLELAAEQCADGLVVAGGVNRRAYAACFVEGLRFAATRGKSTAMAGMPSFTPIDRKGRRKRLDSILSSTISGALSLRSRLLLSIAACGAAGAVFVQAAVAVHPHTRDNEIGVLAQAPVDGDISIAFGEKTYNQKIGAYDKPHRGVDIAARRGADVVSPGAGQVVVATDVYGPDPEMGKVVIIDHGEALKTVYAHLDSIAVSKGDSVWTGETIGKVGSTGDAKNPHLHFETIVAGEPVDPLSVLSLTAATPPRAPKSAAASPPTPRSEPANPRVSVDLPPEILVDAYAGTDKSDKTKTKKKSAKTDYEPFKHRRASQGEALSAAERQAIEKALKDVRREVRAANVEREATRNRQRAEKALAKQQQRRAKAKKDDKKYKRSYAEAQQSALMAQMLAARDTAVETARRSIEANEKQIEQAIEQAHRDFERQWRQTEQSLALSKADKKDAAKFKRELARVEAQLEQARRQQINALRKAEKKIDEQQAEIERLRAALAEPKED
ncbi:MAG: peptidoglycan DD-metalloendopeptidase family protein [Pseudomonadota bacterium]